MDLLMAFSGNRMEEWEEWKRRAFNEVTGSKEVSLWIHEQQDYLLFVVFGKQRVVGSEAGKNTGNGDFLMSFKGYSTSRSKNHVIVGSTKKRSSPMLDNKLGFGFHC